MCPGVTMHNPNSQSEGQKAPWASQLLTEEAERRLLPSRQGPGQPGRWRGARKVGVKRKVTAFSCPGSALLAEGTVPKDSGVGRAVRTGGLAGLMTLLWQQVLGKLTVPVCLHSLSQTGAERDKERMEEVNLGRSFQRPLKILLRNPGPAAYHLYTNHQSSKMQNVVKYIM